MHWRWGQRSNPNPKPRELTFAWCGSACRYDYTSLYFSSLWCWFAEHCRSLFQRSGVFAGYVMILFAWNSGKFIDAWVVTAWGSANKSHTAVAMRCTRRFRQGLCALHCSFFNTIRHGRENARHENARNTKYGKPRLYKHVTMYVVYSLVLICNRLRQH